MVLRLEATGASVQSPQSQYVVSRSTVVVQALWPVAEFRECDSRESDMTYESSKTRIFVIEIRQTESGCPKVGQSEFGTRQISSLITNGMRVKRVVLVSASGTRPNNQPEN